MLNILVSQVSQFSMPTENQRHRTGTRWFKKKRRDAKKKKNKKKKKKAKKEECERLLKLSVIFAF